MKTAKTRSFSLSATADAALAAEAERLKVPVSTLLQLYVQKGLKLTAPLSPGMLVRKYRFRTDGQTGPEMFTED